jgi:hypothetical protein
MKTYKVTASSITYYIAEIQAESESEAFLQAKQMDGADFVPDTYKSGEPVADWAIYSVTEVKHG